MDVPRGFKRWRFHWFGCPACGHRSHRAFTSVGMTRQPLGIVWRFWCERCGAFSALKEPRMAHLTGALIFLFIGPLSFLFLYRGMAAGLGFEWLVLLFGLFWISQPLVILGLTRWLYRYVPAA